ncbi:NAD(P)-dependent dehydrogenase (short-subunit alcohol dehydrogenase family) [Paenibacillus rhizosphaerae]|uniref:NAD(P)-dependent dehydrogenase (Short-subunit alcohol dehydrogenase family) n=1 Tax=Paenibacillus rhizosphaerae TaxID=297318 RepID=A0A839TSR6_9BACL|nr:SDR family oxidoreductase [Paenibacillus rhizosphaerae]MBB3127767.1 NAD(P)-dependent dehydrogenase (short-subunit alcohol dehydrogenase family) [Paenibacillus rhizosphaerae]
MNYPFANYGVIHQCKDIPVAFPPDQHQHGQPGIEYVMNPLPVFENPNYIGTGKLKDKVAIITGGDSGIGRAVAIAFAKEGADLVIVYLNEHRDAQDTERRIRQLGRSCLLLPVDVRSPGFASYIVERTLQTYGKIDILINNAAVQFVRESLLDISEEQLRNIFEVNILSFILLTKAVLPHLRPGSSIINTASVNAYIGHDKLMDYSSTKGAIVSFSRALARNLASQSIRVNTVAPGPVWTPLIPATMPPEMVATFGRGVPLGRAAQPYELAPAYVLLASNDGSYITGQTIHVNGGQMVTD